MIQSPCNSENVPKSYIGLEGENYFRWQRQHGARVWKFNQKLWLPFLRDVPDVLDFGCGGGFLLSHIESPKKLGVEINPAAREFAASIGVSTVASLHDVPSASFSLVISSHALEHVASPFDTLTEIFRILVPNGRFVTYVPLDDWRARNQRTYQTGDRNMHLQTWTPRLLGNLLSSTGFQVETIRVINHAWPPFADRIWDVSPRLFDVLAGLTSVLARRRQLHAVAVKKRRE